MTSDRRYRPDVDGLRAIAVLAVILFHLDKSLLPGGFAGVDVFFVISGFLITRNIIGEIDRGSFSIAEFYRRRIKRIAPAMLVVVAVTLALSQVLLLPDDARDTAKSAVWSLASMANVYFWLYQDNGYFAADSAHAPLLHLWSLGIEEQFYLAWPLLLWAFYRPGAGRRFFALALAALAASFALGDALSSRAPSFAYYMLPTRAGELLAGGLVAFACRRGDRDGASPALLGACAAAGAVLLIGSLGLLNERLPFPGVYALPPTLGAALLIFGGNHAGNLATRALSMKPLVWVGLISYSAYLWHWPLLAFYRYGYGVPGLTAGTAIFSLTIALAWLTYRYVEQPVRRSRASVIRVALQFFAVPGLALGVVALVLVYPARLGVELQAQGYRRALAALRVEAQPAFMFDWVCQRQRVAEADALDPRCVLGAGAPMPPNAILWGDSNAAHYIGVVDAIARAAGFRFRNLEVGSCPPVHGDPAPYVEVGRLADCRASLALVRSVIGQYPVVIISASWSSYQDKDDRFLEQFFQTVRDLTGDGKLVILIGKAPVMEGYDRLCREKALSYPFLSCARITRPMSVAVPAINDRLRSFAALTANVRYFDANRFVCSEGLCSAFAADGRPLYYDPSHLTAKASAELGSAVVAADGVPAAFADVSRWRAPSR